MTVVLSAKPSLLILKLPTFTSALGSVKGLLRLILSQLHIDAFLFPERLR